MTKLQEKTEYKQGYKNTKLGWIPEEWEVVRLGDCFTLTSGITKPKDLSEFITNHKNIPVYGGNGIIGYSAEVLFDNEFIIIGRVGEKCGCVYYHEGKAWITDNALYTNKLIKHISLKYFNSLLVSKDLNKLRNKGGQPLVSQKPIYAITIPLPSFSEQQKIAEVLTSWDNAIEKTEKLIEFRQKSKKAFMQSLLTGKLRFPQFAGHERKIVKLKDYLNESSIKNNKNQVQNVLSVTNSRGFINQDEQFERSVASKDLKGYKIVKKGQFAYNPSRINVGSIDLLKTFDTGIVSPIYVIFETKEDILLSEYLKHFFKTYNFFEQMKAFTQGGVRDSLSFKGLSMMKMFIPSIEEQKKIVAVLNSCDREIETLKQKLSKLNEQKKGLMQKLLTGQVRVKV